MSDELSVEEELPNAEVDATSSTTVEPVAEPVAGPVAEPVAEPKRSTPYRPLLTVKDRLWLLNSMETNRINKMRRRQIELGLKKDEWEGKEFDAKVAILEAEKNNDFQNAEKLKEDYRNTFGTEAPEIPGSPIDTVDAYAAARDLAAMGVPPSAIARHLVVSGLAPETQSVKIARETSTEAVITKETLEYPGVKSAVLGLTTNASSALKLIQDKNAPPDKTSTSPEVADQLRKMLPDMPIDLGPSGVTILRGLNYQNQLRSIEFVQYTSTGMAQYIHRKVGTSASPKERKEAIEEYSAWLSGKLPSMVNATSITQDEFDMPVGLPTPAPDPVPGSPGFDLSATNPALQQSVSRPDSKVGKAYQSLTSIYADLNPTEQKLVADTLRDTAPVNILKTVQELATQYGGPQAEGAIDLPLDVKAGIDAQAEKIDITKDAEPEASPKEIVPEETLSAGFLASVEVSPEDSDKYRTTFRDELWGEEGVNATGGMYTVYNDTEGFTTTGRGLKVEKDQVLAWGGQYDDEGVYIDHSATAPKDYVDSENIRRMEQAWEEALALRAEAFKEGGEIPIDSPALRYLAQMMYQMGDDGVRGFSDMVTAIKEGDFEAAAQHMLTGKGGVGKSDLVQQTPDRALKASEAFKALAEQQNAAAAMRQQAVEGMAPSITSKKTPENNPLGMKIDVSGGSKPYIPPMEGAPDWSRFNEFLSVLKDIPPNERYRHNRLVAEAVNMPSRYNLLPHEHQELVQRMNAANKEEARVTGAAVLNSFNKVLAGVGVSMAINSGKVFHYATPPGWLKQLMNTTPGTALGAERQKVWTDHTPSAIIRAYNEEHRNYAQPPTAVSTPLHYINSLRRMSTARERLTGTSMLAHYDHGTPEERDAAEQYSYNRRFTTIGLERGESVEKKGFNADGTRNSLEEYPTLEAYVDEYPDAEVTQALRNYYTVRSARVNPEGVFMGNFDSANYVLGEATAND